MDTDGIPGGYTEGLGTVGRGNHFVELARVGTVLDAAHAARLGLAAGDLVLVVHSGSRGFGERILRAHTEVHGAGPAADPAAYLAAHDDAVRWGSLNRRLLAARVALALGAQPAEPVVDQCHNLVKVREGVYLHRKGAAPGDGRDVLVAGTRGTPSYLVAAHAGAEANHSVAHGAGRKMSRADALRRGKAKHTVEELRRTPVGSLVVCGDRQLLFEEAPTAYKRIEQVIGDLVEHRLATPVATTVPLVTYKTADAGQPRERADRPDRRRGRFSR
jgi:release factor H-coupled RctB family protein